MLGNGGSGKSTLTRLLAERLGLPAVHLDTVYWGPGWTAPQQQAWETAHDTVLAGPDWVADGSFRDTLAGRLERADLAVLLDLPTAVCLAGALRRLVRQRLPGAPERPDLPAGCAESFDPSYLRWVLSYRRRELPEVEHLLARSGVPVERFRTRAAARAWALAR